MQKKRETYNCLIFENIKKLEIKTRNDICQIIYGVQIENEWDEYVKASIAFAIGLFSEAYIQRTYYNGRQEFPELHNEGYFFIARKSPRIATLLKSIEEFYLKELFILTSKYNGGKKEVLNDRFRKISISKSM